MQQQQNISAYSWVAIPKELNPVQEIVKLNCVIQNALLPSFEGLSPEGMTDEIKAPLEETMRALEEAGQKIRALIYPKPIGLPDIKDLAEFISSQLGYELWTLQKRTRKFEIVQSRHILSYLIRKSLPYCSLKQIGGLFEKDHTTVIHSCQTVQNRIDTEPEYKAQVLHLCNIIYKEYNIKIEIK